MKELSIVFNNADYIISNYELKRRPIRVLAVEYIDYAVTFEDKGMKEQFGDPFEFYTQSKPKFDIFLPNESQHWKLADVIIKAINKAEIQ